MTSIDVNGTTVHYERMSEKPTDADGYGDAQLRADDVAAVVEEPVRFNRESR